jgi:hypothetical protein
VDKFDFGALIPRSCYYRVVASSEAILKESKESFQGSKGTLLTIFTNIFAASLNDDIIVLCHDRPDWMHPERFIM